MSRKRPSHQKPLLVFAHRGEAQAFLELYRCKQLSMPVADLFSGKDFYLLICGEGIQAATEKTAAVCGAFGESISGVVNLGIAGALNDRLQTSEVVSVRTVYGHRGDSVAFHSFTSADATAKLDCISAGQRVLKSPDAVRLRPFADLVDRELWGIASVCKLFRLPFRAFKLVSDRPGSGEMPDVSAENVEIWSRQLLNFYQNNTDVPIENSRDAELLLPEAYYASFTQQKQLENLVHALQLKLQIPAEAVLDRAGAAEIASKNMPPKQRTALLLETLTDMLNPFNAALKKRLEVLCEPLTDAGARVKFARDYEDDNVELTVKIEHPRHLDKLRNALAQFDYPAVVRLLNGDLSEK